MVGAFCLFFPSIIHRASESCWRVQETEGEKVGERGGLLMVWGIKAQNKVAEIHTHKPGRAGEATHCGLLVEKWWFQSLELRKALGWVWSAPARAVFIISSLSIALRSPDLQGHPIHLIWFCETALKCNLYFSLYSSIGVLSVRQKEEKQHFQTYGFISSADPQTGITYRHVLWGVAHKSGLCNRPTQVSPFVIPTKNWINKLNMHP